MEIKVFEGRVLEIRVLEGKGIREKGVRGEKGVIGAGCWRRKGY